MAFGGEDELELGPGDAPVDAGAPVAAIGPQPCARMEVRSVIAWNIRRIRVSRGMSQRSLALASGLDLSYLGGLERGRQNPTVDTLGKLAKSLSAPLITLFVEPSRDAHAPPSLKRGRRRAQ